MSLMWLTIWLCLYPLCFNLCINLHVILLKFVSFEFVLRYRCVSPLLIAFIVEGGGMRLHGHIAACLCL